MSDKIYLGSVIEHQVANDHLLNTMYNNITAIMMRELGRLQEQEKHQEIETPVKKCTAVKQFNKFEAENKKPDGRRRPLIIDFGLSYQKRNKSGVFAGYYIQ